MGSRGGKVKWSLQWEARSEISRKSLPNENEAACQADEFDQNEDAKPAPNHTAGGNQVDHNLRRKYMGNWPQKSNCYPDRVE